MHHCNSSFLILCVYFLNYIVLSLSLYRLIETFEDLASTLAQRNDTNTTGNVTVVLNSSGNNSAVVIERVH